MADIQKHHMSSEDERIKARLHAVPIPEGLAERLRAALTEPAIERNRFLGTEPKDALGDSLSDAWSIESAESASEASPVRHAPAADAELLINSPTSSSRGGRYEIVRRAILVLALAGALAGFAILANQWRQPLERSWLEAHCQEILERWEKQDLASLDVAQTQLPTAIEQQLVRVSPTGSLSLASLGSKLAGRLYRLDGQDGRGLVLLKLTNLRAVRGLSSRFSPLNSPSGGWSLAAIAIDNEVFVLAAVGTEQQLFAYIHRPAVT